MDVQQLRDVDTLQNGSGDFTDAPANFTFPGASSISGNYSPSPQGGESSFTDFIGNTWTGSGGSGAGGHSLQWNPDFEGGFFELTLDTSGLQDLNIRMGVRDAIGSGGSRAGGFSSFTYDLDDGNGALAIPGTPGFGTNNNFNEWSMDLSSITEIANQSTVIFRWELPDIAGNSSLRIDNVQFTAIPEPSTLMLVTICGLFGLAITRIKRR